MNPRLQLPTVTFQDKLRALKAAGMCFAECVAVFGVPRDATPLAMCAWHKYHEDGRIEIDETTVLSGSGDDGDYVLAWVWVDNPEVG